MPHTPVKLSPFEGFIKHLKDKGQKMDADSIKSLAKNLFLAWHPDHSSEDKRKAVAVAYDYLNKQVKGDGSLDTGAIIVLIKALKDETKVAQALAKVAAFESAAATATAATRSTGAACYDSRTASHGSHSQSTATRAAGEEKPHERRAQAESQRKQRRKILDDLLDEAFDLKSYVWPAVSVLDKENYTRLYYLLRASCAWWDPKHAIPKTQLPTPTDFSHYKDFRYTLMSRRNRRDVNIDDCFDRYVWGQMSLDACVKAVESKRNRMDFRGYDARESTPCTSFNYRRIVSEGISLVFNQAELKNQSTVSAKYVAVNYGYVHNSLVDAVNVKMTGSKLHDSTVKLTAVDSKMQANAQGLQLIHCTAINRSKLVFPTHAWHVGCKIHHSTFNDSVLLGKVNDRTCTPGETTDRGNLHIVQSVFNRGQFGLGMYRCRIQQSTFNRVDMSGNFHGVMFKNVLFDHVDFSGDFRDCCFAGSHFRACKLPGKLHLSDLSLATISHCDLTELCRPTTYRSNKGQLHFCTALVRPVKSAVVMPTLQQCYVTDVKSLLRLVLDGFDMDAFDWSHASMASFSRPVIQVFSQYLAKCRTKPAAYQKLLGKIEQVIGDTSVDSNISAIAIGLQRQRAPHCFGLYSTETTCSKLGKSLSDALKLVATAPVARGAGAV